MLNKGLRDEESIRIDNVLRTLLSLVFIPETWNPETENAVENQLQKWNWSLKTLADFSPNELLEQLLDKEFDWNQLEQFADFLIQYSKKTTLISSDFSEKAIVIYNAIQTESKTFSLAISTKIAAVKAHLS
jgi:hypothetical protein